MTILATVIVLGVLIFVHELGHFLAAKSVGVEVQRFSIGLGPRVWGFVRGETEYVLSMIPLGGYVKMGGMDDEVMERIEGGASAEPRIPGPRDFDAKPIWARALVISAGVIMNMIFAFGVYTFVTARWGMPQLDTTRVGHVDKATLPSGAEDLASIQPGAHIVRIGTYPIKNWGDVRRRLLAAPSGPLTIETSDPEGTVVIQVPAKRSARQDLVGSLDAWADAGVGAVEPGSPAERAGIEVGDRIIAVAGVGVHNWWDFQTQVEKRPGQHVDLTLLRDGRRIIRPVTLDSEARKRPDGTTEKVGRVGIYEPAGQYSYAPVSLGDAFTVGYRQTVAVTAMILQFLENLVTGHVSPRSVGSIITIGQASGQAAAAGVYSFLSFMALFSVNLAVLNLLPIPVLDGGHLLFLGIEAVRGRALSIEQRLRWSNVGLIIIAGIMLWALSNDFLRLLGM
jgi:regulator of sigma E protease